MPPGLPARPGAWREALSIHASWPDLLHGAGSLLGARLGLIVTARRTGDPGDATPALMLERNAIGWRCRLAGCAAWSGRRRWPSGDGSSGSGWPNSGNWRLPGRATCRNPLNIAAMAAADALPEVRREIAEQVGRMELLVCNVLDYARVWRLECRPMRLAEAVERALTGVPGRL